MAEHAWRALEAELTAWADAGLAATFWWRDDDASAPSAVLERLLALRCRYRVPLAIAVIPGRMDPALPVRLCGEGTAPDSTAGGFRPADPSEPESPFPFPSPERESGRWIPVAAEMTKTRPDPSDPEAREDASKPEVREGAARHSRTSGNPRAPLGHRPCRSGLAVLQHGFAHRNHASAGEKSIELGPHRAREQVLDELERGLERLAAAFGEDFLPVLVPPWNRIAAPLLPALPARGLRGLSTFAPRSARLPAPGLRQVNCHVDLIDWRGGRGGRDHALLADEIRHHLHARRRGRVDAEEATGVLTHHLDHDERAWAFMEELLERTAGHSGVHWPPLRELFPA